MTTNLFEAPRTEGNNTDPNRKYYEELVGEDKKYKTNEDLAKSRIEADNFIETLKRENAEFRQELSTRKTLEEVLDKINTRDTTRNNDDTRNHSDGNNNDGIKGLSEEDILKLVDNKVSERERLRIQEENLAHVRNSLIQKFGNEYVSKLKEVTSKLNVDEAFLQDMAKDRPEVFLRLVDTGEPNKTTNNSLFNPPQTNLNIQSTKFSPTGHKTMSYYEKIKDTDPKRYWSTSIQSEMHQEAIRQGESFFDT